MKPVPIDQLERRLPTAGRIRIGKTVPGRSGAPRPEKLSTFRFTSQDKAAIEQVAALYGGTVTPWKGHEGQWEVYTPADMVKVVLPPNPLGNTPLYELWDGSGCLRRCDGVTVTMRVGGPDGGDVVEKDCICWANDRLECARKTRLSVILPEVRFLGVWRIDTGSKIASEELPGMVETFQHLYATRGLPYAELRLVRHRVPVVDAQGRRSQSWAFIPTLGFDQSPEQLAVAGPPMAQLEPGPEPRGELVSANPDMVTPSVDPDIEPIAVSAYHPDPDLVLAWKDSLTATQQNKVLRLVRDGWAPVTMPPATFDDIPLEVIDHFMEKGIEGVERRLEVASDTETY